ncbi:MAG: hypothetical protein QOE32_126 [Pseudonocardiales bacterium]|nr:hypothetical protein [Pseudonocardiales bacterium]MDT7669386.1 hypothetical protein [Pseudonocardiales bacterium]
MALTGEYVPSPSDRVREQVALYEGTGGVRGGLWSRFVVGQGRRRV